LTKLTGTLHGDVPAFYCCQQLAVEVLFSSDMVCL